MKKKTFGRWWRIVVIYLTCDLVDNQSVFVKVDPYNVMEKVFQQYSEKLGIPTHFDFLEIDNEGFLVGVKEQNTSHYYLQREQLNIKATEQMKMFLQLQAELLAFCSTLKDIE